MTVSTGIDKMGKPIHEEDPLGINPAYIINTACVTNMNLLYASI